MSTDTTRRGILAALPALAIAVSPAAALGANPALPAVDPVFAAIEATREEDAFWTVFETMPTTTASEWLELFSGTLRDVLAEAQSLSSLRTSPITKCQNANHAAPLYKAVSPLRIAQLNIPAIHGTLPSTIRPRFVMTRKQGI
jgi:hypothetical protein